MDFLPVSFSKCSCSTIAVVFGLLFLVLYFKAIRLPKKSVKGKHVVVTGGSKGIGKSVALTVARNGAHVTIIARNIEDLKSAVNEIQKACVSEDQIVKFISADVTNYDEIEKELNWIEKEVGPIFMLVNCAGYSLCGKFEDFPLEEEKRLMNINYFGTVNPIKIVFPKMKERNEGIIVLTGSQLSLVGMFGFSAYSASKFALRGLAESLDMECTNYNISVTFCLPPDTNTPGFENENKSKPIETATICNTGGLMEAEDVAKQLYKDAMMGQFFSYVGFESFLSTTLCTGVTRASSAFQLTYQFFLLGSFRILAYFYLLSFYDIIKNCAKNKKTD